MTLKEALYMRGKEYQGWSDCDLKADARRDILLYLNCLTDQLLYSSEDVAVMAKLAKAVHYLEGGEEPIHDTTVGEVLRSKHRDIFDTLEWMRSEMAAFLEAKDGGKEAPEHLEKLFEAHRKLASHVMAVPATERERAVIVSSAKK